VAAKARVPRRLFRPDAIQVATGAWFATFLLRQFLDVLTAMGRDSKAQSANSSDNRG
jgi:hypothetical protein